MSPNPMQLDLAIRRTEKPPPVARRQRWTDARGHVFAWSCGSSDHGRFEFPGTGVFRFSRESSRVLALVPPGADTARVERSFLGVVAPLALQTRGWQALHASAVSTPQGVVCLCGRSGAGKSTLAQGWVAQGAEPWADDTVNFRPGASRPETIQLEGPAAGSRSVLAGTARRIAALVVIEPALGEDRCSDTLEALEPASALDALLPHALCLDPANAALLEGLFAAYAELVRAVPTHRFRYRQTRSGVTGRVRRIARRVESNRPIGPAVDRGRRELP